MPFTQNWFLLQDLPATNNINELYISKFLIDSHCFFKFYRLVIVTFVGSVRFIVGFDSQNIIGCPGWQGETDQQIFLTVIVFAVSGTWAHLAIYVSVDVREIKIWMCAYVNIDFPLNISEWSEICGDYACLNWQNVCKINDAPLVFILILCRMPRRCC